MTKLVICKTCGAQMATSAKACPACGAKNKKPIYKKWWFWTIIALILIISISSGGGKDNEAKPAAASPTASTPETVASNAPTATPQKDIFGVGESAELNNIVVTLISADESTGKDYTKPADGKVFILCDFEIANNSDDEISISSIMSFEAYVDDYSTSMSLTAQIASGAGQLDGTIAPGKKMAGVIGYEVPVDWKTLEVSLTPDFWQGKDIKFLVENSN